MKRVLSMALGLVVAFAPAAMAQQSKGNIYGTVTDESGAALPGCAVSLTGEFGTSSTTADSTGRYRFLGVDHGTHTLTATLSGFAGVTREVVVRVGMSTTIDFGLKVASVEEIVTVTAETPAIDTKKLGTSTTISKDELSRIPQSRDPWALMRTVPGILVDRVNVAGSESGQQSQFFGKGADPKDAVWSIDGIVITDQVSMSSPGYYTYDQFDEVSFETGGNDVSMSSGGMGINFATKRGTNDYHGSIGGYFTHDDLQSSNIPAELAGDPRLEGNDKADHTEQIADYSFDLGGPIVKDKLWFYGSYGKNDIRIKRLTQTRDKTVLENMSAKLNWQASPNDMVSFFWFDNAKTKVGRAASGLQEAASHTRDQGGAYQDGRPHGLSKLEWNHIFGPSLFLNVKAGYYNNGFTLTPQGGLDTREVIDNVAAEATGSSPDFTFLRPQYTANADLSYFRSGWGGNHEVKIGAGYRINDEESTGTQPGDKVQVRFNTGGPDAARFFRDAVTSSRGEHLSLYLSDTFTKDRMTLTASVRFDNQKGKARPTVSTENPAIPDVMPALEFAGLDDQFSWTNLSPRVGLTYALSESGRTVARASYAHYAGLSAFAQDSNWNNPVGTSILQYDWFDANGDRDVQLSEVDFSALQLAANIDPNNPTAASSPSLIDPDYHANLDDEIVLGIDHELMPDLAVSAAYTWRRSSELTSTQLWSGTYWYNWLDSNGTPFTSADFVAQAPVTANGVTSTTYAPTDAANDAFSGGIYLTNRDDLSRNFNGFELSLHKRLSNRWMARAAFSLNDWRENVGPGAIQSPTRHDWDPLDDGGQVVIRSAGSGKIFYSNARWQVNMSGLVQLGKGFDLAANVFGRQGYPNPVYQSLSSGFDGTLRVLADGVSIDDNRFKSIWNVDVRLAKAITVGNTNVMLSAEAFNVLNSAAELKRLNQADSSSFGRLDEILAPRIIRFGVRLTF